VLELRRFCLLVWKWKWILVAVTCIASAVSWTISALDQPVYRATRLLAAGPFLEGYSLTETDLRVGQELARNYAQLARLDPLAKALAVLGLSGEPGGWADSVSAQAVEGTQFLRLAVADGDPIRAGRVADEWARQLIACEPESRKDREAVTTTLFSELRGLERDIEYSRNELEALREAIQSSSQRKDEKARVELLEQRMDSLRSDYLNILTQLKSYHRLSLAEPADGRSVLVSRSVGTRVLIAGFAVLLITILIMLLVEYPALKNS